MTEIVSGLKPDTKPAVRQRTLVNTEETIPNDPEHDVFYNAFTSQAFQARIDSGTRRLMQHRAESGFSILSNTQTITYTPLALGGRLAEDINDVRIGHKASVPFPQVSDKWFKDHVHEGHRLVTTMHFHPSNFPFSSTDIEAYEYDIEGYGAFECRPDMYFGIFMPQWQGETLPSIRLFMFSGPAKDNYYQAEDFSNLVLNRQKELMEKSGMKVVLVDLPITNGHVDLSPLKATFRRISSN